MFSFSVAIVIKQQQQQKKDFTFIEFMAKIKDYQQTGLAYGPLHEAVKTLAESNKDLELVSISYVLLVTTSKQP